MQKREEAREKLDKAPSPLFPPYKQPPKFIKKLSTQTDIAITSPNMSPKSQQFKSSYRHKRMQDEFLNHTADPQYADFLQYNRPKTQTKISGSKIQMLAQNAQFERKNLNMQLK
jgi:hypothetical protein